MPYRVLRRMVLAGKAYKRGDMLRDRELSAAVRTPRHKEALLHAGYLEIVDEDADGGGREAPARKAAQRKRRLRKKAEV